MAQKVLERYKIERGSRCLSHLSSRKNKTYSGNTVFPMLQPEKHFLDHLNAIEAKPKTKFGLHSLRSGGASAAANSGVSDRLIGKHGRWSSNSSRDGYIKDSKLKRLSVTKSLGL